MGRFAEEIFGASGETGYPYRLWKHSGDPFEMQDLDLAHQAISESGREVVMGALDRSHHEGIIKVKPKLEEEDVARLGALGIGEASIVPAS